MRYGLLADLIVTLHFAFVLFVVLGGVLALRWPRAALVHLPVALYGVLVEFVGFVCPLTPLENHFRRLGGEAGYQGGFVEHYVLPVLYPHALTRGTQLVLGLLVIVVNVTVYGLVWRRARRVRRPRSSPRRSARGGRRP